MKKPIALGLIIALGLLVSTLIVYRIDSRSFNSSEAKNTINRAALYFSEPYIKDDYQHIDILLSSYNNPVSGVDVKIYYTQTAVKVVSVVKSISSPFESYPIAKFDDEKGTINVAANIGLGNKAEAVIGNNIKIAEIKYSVLDSEEKIPYRFDFVKGKRNDSNVVLMTENSGESPVDILTDVYNSSEILPTKTIVKSDVKKSLFHRLIDFFRK